MADVYYNPEEFGLKLVGMAEVPDLHYEFSMFAVWKDSGGLLYFASDAGCSCPSPFEDFTSIDSLTQADAAVVHAALDEWAGMDAGTQGEAAALHAKVAEL